MRIAILGLSHETNTFSQLPTSLDMFERETWTGDEIFKRFGNSYTTLGGFFEAALQENFETVPLIFSKSTPLGPITAEAFNRLSKNMIIKLRENGPFDGVLLALHGAAVAENERDVDGSIVTRVREAIGPKVPLGVVYDMHGNVSSNMIEPATATVFYRTNPHLDAHERGLECGIIIARTVRGEISPYQSYVCPPLVIGITRQNTSESPMLDIITDLEKVLAEPGILSASVVQGYPYADVLEMGMAFVVISDANATLAQDRVDWLAQRSWERREEMRSEAHIPEIAFDRALNVDTYPIGMLDIGDNIGGGGSGDSTVLLNLALVKRIKGVLVTLWDPIAVSRSIELGVGAKIDLKIGGKTDPSTGPPIQVTGHIRLISDGNFEEPETTHGGNRYFEAGVTVVLETEHDTTIVLTSQRVGNVSLQQMYSIGIFPESKKIIILKGVNSPLAAYQRICTDFILVDTPGVTSSNLEGFNYVHRRRPLYPFETNTIY